MSEITKAIQHLCDEKGLAYDSVMEAIEFALAAAYRKDFGNKQQNIKVKFDPESGDMKTWDVKTIVEDIEEDVLKEAQEELMARREKARDENRDLTDEELEDLPRFNPKLEMMITEAKEIKKKVKLGDVLEIDLEIPSEFGRMAAQTAKQVIIQKVREAERIMVFDDFKEQEGEIIMGTIQRVEGRKVLIDLGKITGIVPSDKQIGRDIYRPGARMKFLVLSVEMSPRGPQIILSRSDNAFVEEIFKQEIPEIGEGAIEIKGVAREPGFRSKVAVASNDDSIDPIGSCIGQRGGRINTIIEELGGEKVDIISFSEDAAAYITNSMSPAKILQINLNEEEKSAEAIVVSDQFSLAIGRGGQNVRLAAELTGWNINVKEEESSVKPSESSDNDENIEGEPKSSEDKDVSEDEVKVEEKSEDNKTEEKEDKKKVKKTKKATKKTKKTEEISVEEKKEEVAPEAADEVSEEKKEVEKEDGEEEKSEEKNKDKKIPARPRQACRGGTGGGDKEEAVEDEKKEDK